MEWTCQVTLHVAKLSNVCCTIDDDTVLHSAYGRPAPAFRDLTEFRQESGVCLKYLLKLCKFQHTQLDHFVGTKPAPSQLNRNRMGRQ